MASIQPKTLAIVGPLLLGAVTALAGALTGMGQLELGMFFVIGLFSGCLLFWPWAAATAFFQKDIEWTLQQSLRIQVYVALFGGVSIGYVIACFANQIFNASIIIPTLVMMICAAVKGSFVNVVKASKQTSPTISEGAP